MNRESGTCSVNKVVSFSRALLVLILLACVTSGYFLWRGGVQLDTSLSDLTPPIGENRALARLIGRSSAFAESSVILVLQSDDAEAMEEASDSIVDQFSIDSDYIEVVEDAEVIKTLVETLKSHRFYLLSPEHKELLIADRTTELLDNAVSELYSSVEQFRPLDFDEDPLNLFGHWLQSSAIAASIGTDSTESSDKVDTEIIKLRLTGNYNEVTRQEAIVSRFRALSEELTSNYPQVTLYRSGVVFFASESAESAKRDINLVSIGSFMGLFLLMLLVFRSLWPLAVPVISILIGLLSAFVSVHVLFGSVHVFTIVFGASLMGIVIDYSIHYFFHLRAHAEQSGLTESEGKVPSGGSLYRALFLSLLTSVLAFSALMIGSVPSLLKIGVFSVVGLSTAWLTVVALGSLVSKSSAVFGRSAIDPISRLPSTLQILLDKRFYLACSVVVLGVLLLAGLLSLRFEDDPRKFIDMPRVLLEESSAVNRLISPVEPGRFIVIEAASEQLLFDRLNELSQQTNDRDQLVSALGLIPSPDARAENYRLQSVIYHGKGLINELNRQLGLDPQDATPVIDDLVKHYEVAADDRFRIDDFFAGLNLMPLPLVSRSDEGFQGVVLLKHTADQQSIKLAVDEIDGATIVDTVKSTTTELKRQRSAVLWALLISYGLLAAALGILYGAGRALRMVGVPALSTLVTLAILGLTGQSLTLFHCMALFMILGLGMDYVIFKSEMTSDAAATRQAITLSGMTTLVSFGFLAASSIPVAQGFGLTVMLGNILNLTLALGVFQISARDGPDIRNHEQ